MTTSIHSSADGTYGELRINGNPSFRFGADTSGQLYGFRNLLINPSGGRIYQRAIASTADDTYFADRWYALTESGNITPSVLVDPENDYPDGCRLTQPNATAQRYGFAQIVEGKNCKMYRGSSGVLAPRIRVSSSVAIRYAVLGWTGTEDTVTSDVVLNWSSASFTAGGFFLASNVSVLAIGSSTSSANTWTTLPAIAGALGSSFNNLIVMVWTESAQAQNFTLDFDWVQLEKGAIATPADVRPYEIELARCQRYYQRFHVRVYGYSAAGDSLYQTMPLLVSMRADPTPVAAGTWTPTNVSSVAHFAKQNSYAISITPTASGMCGYASSATAEMTLEKEL